VSVASPQDVPSAIFGNPATLSQFEGTQFSLGGGWVEGYPTVTRHGFQLPAENYSVTSRTQGFVTPAVGVIQDLRSLGVPGALGIGLAGIGGLGAEYRGRAPEGSITNDWSSELLILGMNMGAGVAVTDKLSLGATMTLGTGFEQMGLVPNTAMVHDYALRGNFGADYALNDCNTVGAFYQTTLGFDFPNAFLLPNGQYANIRMDQPATVGFGWSNNRLMDGNLLIAADVYYKLWEDAAMYKDIYINQWVFAVGAQLTRGKIKYRLGYSYNTNPINHDVGSAIGGLPVLQDRIYFFQAANTATITQHRITAGFGREDFLVSGLDLDFFAGGLLHSADNFGPHTTVDVAAYYVGMGLTWRFGACHPAPSETFSHE
jgi:long-chain fatty acid transport protein